MKKVLTQIGTILRTSVTIIFIGFSLLIAFSISTILVTDMPISQSNTNTNKQVSGSPNIILPEYSIFVWFDDDLYIIETDAESPKLIRAQVEAHHGVDPESFVPQVDQYFSQDEVNTNFTSPHFGYYARIGSVSYKLSDFGGPESS
ncbi:MAG: hypothetical protein AAGD96_15245 [Chloroflexota bacterium]